MLLCYGVDWQVLTDSLDHPVRQDWRVSVDEREPGESQGPKVEAVYLVETALRVDQV